MSFPDDRSSTASHSLPMAARIAIWIAISLVGVFVSLQIMFAGIEFARPLIGPIADDSVKERLLVAGGYVMWFALSALISVVAWRRLISR